MARTLHEDVDGVAQNVHGCEENQHGEDERAHRVRHLPVGLQGQRQTKVRVIGTEGQGQSQRSFSNFRSP